MQNYQILIEYEGTKFVGWQKQKNGKSIQEEIESCLEKLFKVKIQIFVSGRTDAGVHALAQIAHFDLEKSNIKITKISFALNSFLKKTEQFFNSSFVGLSSGGTHLKARVINVFFSFKPSLIWSEFGWLLKPDLNKQLNKKSADLSPVKTRPVRVAPCAAGASPIIIIFPFKSPNPEIGLPQ